MAQLIKIQEVKILKQVLTLSKTKTTTPTVQSVFFFFFFLVDACAFRSTLSGPGIMATYVDILKTEFPEIDTELFDYITGE